MSVAIPDTTSGVPDTVWLVAGPLIETTGIDGAVVVVAPNTVVVVVDEVVVVDVDEVVVVDVDVVVAGVVVVDGIVVVVGGRVVVVVDVDVVEAGVVVVVVTPVAAFKRSSRTLTEYPPVMAVGDSAEIFSLIYRNEDPSVQVRHRPLYAVTLYASVQLVPLLDVWMMKLYGCAPPGSPRRFIDATLIDAPKSAWRVHGAVELPIQRPVLPVSSLSRMADAGNPPSVAEAVAV